MRTIKSTSKNDKIFSKSFEQFPKHCSKNSNSLEWKFDEMKTKKVQTTFAFKEYVKNSLEKTLKN